MPIYEYQCKACGHHFEQRQNISDPAITLCPSCNKEQVERLISASAFQLKGSGWYETDFKTKKPSSSADDSAAKSDKDSDD